MTTTHPKLPPQTALTYSENSFRSSEVQSPLLFSSLCWTTVEPQIDFCNVAHPLKESCASFSAASLWVLHHKVLSWLLFWTSLMNKTLLKTEALCFPPRCEGITLADLKPVSLILLLCASEGGMRCQRCLNANYDAWKGWCKTFAHHCLFMSFLNVQLLRRIY